MAVKKTIKDKENQNLNKIDLIDATPAAPEDMSYQIARNALAQAAIDALQQYGGTEGGAAAVQYAAAAGDDKVSCVDPADKEKIFAEAVEAFEAEHVYHIKGSLVPADYTDVGEANVLIKEYGHCIRYTKATGWIYYDSKRWAGNYIKAHGIVQQLTERQLKEAREMRKAEKRKKKPNDKRLSAVEAYQNFAYKERNTSRQAACLKEAEPGAEIDVCMLDRDGYLLNTPSGVVNLRTGEIRIGRSIDYITKITSVGPSHDNEDIWYDFLARLTGGDSELQQYLQLVIGMAAIGKVFYEGLIIAVGEGGNGKSTFFNAIKRVLGDYATMVNPDIFIRSSNINKSAEIVTLKGERLTLAAELDSGKSLDAGMLKRISSTDMITARALYKDPIQFLPTHTTIMFTNNLPEVDSDDDGTWDRLIIVPFYTRFRNTSNEIKDYGSYLIDHCGGAILQWIIDGAVKFLQANCKIQRPTCVKSAIARYREENDWLGHFIKERCVVDSSYYQKSSSMYNVYQAYCAETGETKRSMHEFKRAMERAGYPCEHRRDGNFYIGISCKLV
ncbi:MAG: phage/plasmid primase, P4 family [Eubacterium sp.]|nr:phage/plasmid primase, P4 family [Eubacterium sp.]MCH4047386.1 phage/plasmid primase, P4 family [Eubacterium sp.]MCH4080483.1 phage/plasmid primase, P4 family [Eubacterium sp.]MCI1308030.1 phage/plasmid primase, P4 family [Eubacterium sp.]